MNRIADRCQDDARRRRQLRSASPCLESLEGRQLLSTVTGGKWVYPERITYSFMPDGTTIAINEPGSNLFATLNNVTSTANWQGAIEKAMAVWQQQGNFNLALVSDNGTQVAHGDQQGDPNMGDIRIGGMDLGNLATTGILAETFLPPPINGSSDSGDIIFNTNPSVAWMLNSGSGFDVETVALHEIGHSLGLGHSSVYVAEMYAYYKTVQQTLNADDISGIQGLYGAPAADPINDGSFSTATDITSLIDGNAQIALGGKSVTAVSDYDYYKVTVPSNTNGTMVVTMQATNLSSLAPRLAVFRSNTTSIGQSLAVNGYGQTVTFTVNGVTPGQVYYIRCSAANSGAGSDGAYGLLVNFGSNPQSPIAPPYTTVASQPDQSGGSEGLTIAPSGNHGHQHQHHQTKPHRHHKQTPRLTHTHTGANKLGVLQGQVDKFVVGKPHPGR
jgi:hypothetical protein